MWIYWYLQNVKQYKILPIHLPNVADSSHCNMCQTYNHYFLQNLVLCEVHWFGVLSHYPLWSFDVLIAICTPVILLNISWYVHTSFNYVVMMVCHVHLDVTISFLCLTLLKSWLLFKCSFIWFFKPLDLLK